MQHACNMQVVMHVTCKSQFEENVYFPVYTLPLKWPPTLDTVHALKKLTFYGRTTPTTMGVLHSWLRAYYAYGYGRTMPTATGVQCLRLRAYYAHSYGRTWSKATGVLRLRLWAYHGYNYGCATGVLWACSGV